MDREVNARDERPSVPEPGRVWTRLGETVVRPKVSIGWRYCSCPKIDDASGVVTFVTDRRYVRTLTDTHGHQRTLTHAARATNPISGVLLSE